MNKKFQNMILRLVPFKNNLGYILVLTFIVLAASLLSYIYSNPVQIMGDAGSWLNGIREVIEHRAIFPTNSLADGMNGIRTAPNYDLSVPLIAFVSIITNVPYYFIFTYLSILTVPFLLISFYRFSLIISNDRTFSLLSVVIMFLIAGYGDLWANIWDFMGGNSSSKIIGGALYFLTLTEFLKLKNEGKSKISFILSFVLATLFRSNLFIYLVIVISIWIFIDLTILKNKRKEYLLKILLPLLSGTVVSFMYVLLRYMVSAPYFETGFKIQGFIFDSFGFGEILTIRDPSIFNITLIILILITLFYSVRFIINKRKEWTDFNKFYIISTFLPLFVCFIPGVFYLSSKIISLPYTERIIVLIPIQYGLALFVISIIGSFKRGNKYYLIITLPLLLFLLYNIQSRFRSNFKFISQHKYESIAQYVHPDMREAINFINNNTKKDSYFITDVVSGLNLSSYSNVYVSAAWPGHAPATFFENLAPRVNESNYVLNPFTDLDSSLAIIHKYNANYIIVNRASKFPFDWNALEPSVRKTYSELQNSKMQLLGKLIYYNNHVFIYKVFPNNSNFNDYRQPIYPGKVDQKYFSSIIKFDNIAISPWSIITTEKEINIDLLYSSNKELKEDYLIKPFICKRDAINKSLMKLKLENLLSNKINYYDGDVIKFNDDFLPAFLWQPGYFYQNKITLELPQNLENGKHLILFRIIINPNENTGATKNSIMLSDFTSPIEKLYKPIGEIEIHGH